MKTHKGIWSTDNFWLGILSIYLKPKTPVMVHGNGKLKARKPDWLRF